MPTRPSLRSRSQNLKQSLVCTLIGQGESVLCETEGVERLFGSRLLAHGDGELPDPAATIASSWTGRICLIVSTSSPAHCYPL